MLSFSASFDLSFIVHVLILNRSEGGQKPVDKVLNNLLHHSTNVHVIVHRTKCSILDIINVYKFYFAKTHFNL